MNIPRNEAKINNHLFLLIFSFRINALASIPKGIASWDPRIIGEIIEEWYKDKFINTPIYSRDRMPFEFEIKGPAIIEQMDTTTLIEPEDRAFGDNLGNMFIEVGGL